MPSRASKKTKLDQVEEINSIAARIVATATTERPKNPAAVALGKLGASKGGKARAANLTAKKRTEIAKKAAKKRWATK